MLIPPDEDIHVVANAGEGTAVSLHVHGPLLEVVGTSINRVFDLPVLGESEADHSGRVR